jgi:hypothetical protein
MKKLIRMDRGFRFFARWRTIFGCWFLQNQLAMIVREVLNLFLDPARMRGLSQ